MHKYLGIILLGAVIASPASSAEYQSVSCTSKADAQAILSIFMETPSLQHGNTATAEATIGSALKVGTCTVSPFASELTQYANTLHPEGGVRFGIVQQGEEHLLVFQFVNNGGDREVKTSTSD